MANRNRKLIVEETATELTEGKGDAYLFDCKIFREGKKNSFRLDVYRSGDTLSLFARGYLGKGVMKALINPDSTLIYFPTENEHFSGTLDKLVTGKCAESLIFEDILLKLFMMTPPEINESYDGFYLKIINQNSKQQDYQLNSTVCDESIDLTYKLLKDRFIIDNIEYENESGSFKFLAENRKTRIGIDLPANKFQLQIPSNSNKIGP
ncbi:MAG: hypothetical protein ABIJ45_05610 [Candidatus Zixiibacteriota bacterium]